MRESTLVAGWKADGFAEGMRKALLQILRVRFPGQIRDDLVSGLTAESDPDRLGQENDAAANASSVEEFRVLSGY